VDPSARVESPNPRGRNPFGRDFVGDPTFGSTRNLNAVGDVGSAVGASAPSSMLPLEFICKCITLGIGDAALALAALSALPSADPIDIKRGDVVDDRLRPARAGG